MSRFASRDHSREGQEGLLPDKELRYLRTVYVVAPLIEGWDWLPTLHVAMQIGPSHHDTCAVTVSGVWSLRKRSRARPPFLLIACTVRLSLLDLVIEEYGADTQGSQHTAGF